MKISELLILGATKIDAGKAGVNNIDADSVIVGVLDTVYFISAIAAVIVIVIAGLLYTISDGDSAKVTRAKNAIVYAVVGLVIVMSAFVITGFVLGRF